MSIKFNGDRYLLIPKGVEHISPSTTDNTTFVSNEKVWNKEKKNEDCLTLVNQFFKQSSLEMDEVKTSTQEDDLVLKNGYAHDSDVSHTHQIASLEELLDVMRTDGIDGIDGIDFGSIGKSSELSSTALSSVELNTALKELNTYIIHDKQLCFSYRIMSDVDDENVHCILGIFESKKVEYYVKESHVVYSSEVRRDKFYPILRLVIDSFVTADNLESQ